MRRNWTVKGTFRVWQRNWTVWQRSWKISFLPPLLEPLFYLLAFGVGLSALVEEVPYRGEILTYPAFIAPALIGINIMQSAFFENTYASFVRMYYQKTFDAMLTTPLSLPEIIAGEIAWGATKSFIGTALMMTVISAFGLLQFPQALLLLPLSALGGVAFGCMGMICTALVPQIETFNLPMFLLVIPMFLFSGTFFPLENLPGWARALAEILPLTHLVRPARDWSLGLFPASSLGSLAYLTAVIALLLPLALRLMRSRLIR